MRQTEPQVRLVCAGENCGHAFMASARQARRVATGEAKARCSSCRWAEMRKPLAELKTPQLRKARLPVTDNDRLWWLDRFTLAELVDIVSGIYGDDVPPERVRKWARLERDARAAELHAVA